MLRENPRWLEATLAPAQEDDVLELDAGTPWADGSSCSKRAIRSGCGSLSAAAPGKPHPASRTRQIVAWMSGDRSYRTCRQLWNKIPPSYRQGLCFTDPGAHWAVEAYGKVIPQEQHCPCSKQQGETNHLERFNNTLCQRVGRLVRKTLSFSKHLLFHLIHIRAFIRAHNLDCLKRLAPAN